VGPQCLRSAPLPALLYLLTFRNHQKSVGPIDLYDFSAKHRQLGESLEARIERTFIVFHFFGRACDRVLTL
jgi:hypothetical protein